MSSSGMAAAASAFFVGVRLAGGLELGGATARYFKDGGNRFPR
jgi:hypothetical protein